jgi:undecaprenyl-diphosphatase
MDMKRLFTSCFGLGHLPVAPGTWASLPIVLLYGVLKAIDASPSAIAAFMILIVVYGTVVCIRFAPSVTLRLGNADPREIVADEWAGQAMVFVAMGAIDNQSVCAAMLMGFALFRLFDVLKPWPIKKFEKLPGGVGIVADDIVAGVLAMVLLVAVWQLGLLERIAQYVRFTGELNVFGAAVLGAVQGLTEFLPVSSDGHLKLLEWLFGIKREGEAMQLFDVTVHVGTVASVLIVLRRDIIAWLRRLFKFKRYGFIVQQVYARSGALRILVLAIVADIVTVAVYLPLHKKFDAAENVKWLLAAGFACNAVLLLMADRMRRSPIGLRKFDMKSAAWIGLAQAAAIFPSVSRSCSTVCVAILLGVKRRWAVEFSFMAGVPLILGAAFREGWKCRSVIRDGELNGLAFGVGTAVACIVGIFAIKLLIVAARRAKLRYFGYYCMCLAVLLAVYILLS